MPPKKIATFDEIKAAKDLADAKTVDIPEWGLAVKVRGLTRGELRLIAKLEDEEEGNANAIALALLEPKITVEQAREILSEKSLTSTEKLTDAIMEASGMKDGFFVLEKYKEFAREGVDFDLILARELKVTPDQVREMSNYDYQSFYAMFRLEQERQTHARTHEKNRPRKRGRR